MGSRPIPTFLRGRRQTFDEIIRDAAAELAKLEEKATTGSMGWRDLESKLAHELPIRSWMPQGMKSRYAAANLSAQEMAQVCLLRELVRRPKRQTSLETLGLVRLAYPALDTVEIVPAAWKQLAPRIAGDPLEKWRELLAVLLDFFVRSLSAVQILNTDFRRWLGARVNQPLIVRQDEPSVKNRQYPWPGVPAKGTWPRMSRLLAKALALDPSERADRELVHELMGEAFKSLLHANALAQFEGGYRLELSSTRLETVAKGNLCPVTRRVLGRTLLGLSPFQPPSWASQAKCEEVALPRPRYVMRRDVHTGELVEPPVIQEWLESDATVRALREKGVWTEFSDRIASFPDTLYYESAEHSAQVSKARLQQLEKSFKDGRTNLLSCSTTMEMGVDIGGLSAVGMNNAPPGPANYQQRAGRAGRRGENRATVLTLCQGSPHGAAVFANPAWPFTHPVHVPQVSLSSERIVQRHVHSVLLGSYFVQVGAKDTHRLRCQDFFLSKSEGVASAHQDYLRWLQDEAMADEHVKDGVAGVVRGTPLQGPVGPRLDVARQQLQRAATRWKAEHGALMSDLERLGGEPTKEDKGSPAQRAVYAQVRRLREEYLLKTLASEGYLPSYGFPLQVVPFVTTTAEGMKAAKAAGVGRDEGYQRARGFPSRQVDRGIIDYAPGSGVIIDGTVYESRGVTLNWQLQTAGGDYREVQSLRHAWKCRECGAAGDSVRAPKACVQCGAERPRPHRYLEPAGFAVDIRHRPTNDLSKERYIAKREPWISAGGAAWQLFANPRSGWFRYDPDGYVHHNSAGEAGFGYAICLHCGYAESHSDNSLDLTKSFKQHRRLRGGGESGELCDGATGGWGVVTGIRLGASTRTDVIEIQLVDPTSGDSIDNPSVATSIAVALRQALATKLGVDPREIGWTLSRSRGLGTQARGSIVLFDAANGGAGYVSAVAADLGSLLESAKALLKCPEDCDAACHACLLAYDTQFAVDLLDRHAAIEALSDDVLSALRLPKELEYFGPDSKLETLSLRSALYLQGQKAGLTAIRAHLGGPVEDWDYDAWTLRRTLWELNHDGVDVTVVIPERAHQKLEFDEANQLAGRLEADGFRVELAKGSGTQVADGWLILEAQGAQRSIRWATSHPVGLVPDEDWAGPGDETQQARYVVCRSDGPLPDLSAKSVEPKALRKPIPSHFVEVRIFDELDGPIADVGSKFWDRFAKKYPDLDARLYGSTQLASVLYTDCYVCKPLTGRVLYEVLRALKSFSGGLAEFTQLSLITSWSSHPNYPGQIFDDWDDRSLQSETLGSLLDALGAKANPVQLMSRSTLPHHRELVLTWTDGHKIRLRLDSGLGFFFANPSVPLDFRKPAADHAADITSATLSVRANERYSVTKMPVYLSSEAGG